MSTDDRPRRAESPYRHVDLRRPAVGARRWGRLLLALAVLGVAALAWRWEVARRRQLATTFDAERIVALSHADRMVSARRLHADRAGQSDAWSKAQRTMALIQSCATWTAHGWVIGTRRSPRADAGAPDDAHPRGEYSWWSSGC